MKKVQKAKCDQQQIYGYCKRAEENDLMDRVSSDSLQSKDGAKSDFWCPKITSKLLGTG